MCYPYCLWGSMHPCSYPCEDVSIVSFALEVLFVHKLLCGDGYMYHDVFCSIHMVVQVKYFTSMHMYLDLMSDMALLTYSIVVVKSDVDVLTSPG